MRKKREMKQLVVRLVWQPGSGAAVINVCAKCAWQVWCERQSATVVRGTQQKMSHQKRVALSVREKYSEQYA